MTAFIKEVLLENWSLKITSIFLAFILWLVVRGDTPAERVISVPLEVRVQRNMMITNERPGTVDVTVRGVFANMWFGSSLPTYIIDLQSYDEGEHIVQLSPANVHIPRASGLEAIAVRPARLKLVLERTVAKEVPIRVVTRGEPGTGIDVYGIMLAPSTVVLSGPRSSVDRIQEISTETISIEGQRQSTRTFANLDIRDDAVHSTPPGPVEVSIQLGPHRRLQRVTGIPVGTDSPGAKVVPRTVAVLVLVPITFEKPLTAGDFVATVSLSNSDPEARSVTLKPDVRLKNPSDPAIVIRNVSPAEVAIQRAKNN